MATNTNNGSSEHQNQLSPLSSLDGISPCPQTYYSSIPGWGPRDDDDWNSLPLPVLFAVFLSVILLLRFFCSRGVPTDTAVEDARGGGDDGTTVLQLQSNEYGGGWVRRSPSSMVAGAAVEMAPPLVCAYKKADRLGEDLCGVCLADLADGEAVRVLPACRHYFHAACVNEWLRAHDTCPLCRAQLIAPSAAT